MSANPMGKVIGFQSGNTLAEDIMTFLNDKNFKPKTREAYQTDVVEFLAYFCKGKDIASISEEDLVEYDEVTGKPVKFKFTYSQVKKYRNYLSEKGLANVTVNRKMSAVNSLFTELAKDRPYFNIAVLKVTPLDDTSEQYGDFSKEEINMMLEKVKEYEGGYQKYLAIKLLCITSFRVSSLLNLTWSNIKKHDDNTYVVKAEGAAIGKGNKKDAKSINKEMYDELLMLKGEDNKVFHMHRKTLWDTINKLVKDLGLDPQNERNLCVHSLKNYGINRILETGGSVVAAQRQGNHKSAKTTLEKYARYTDDPTQNPSLTIMNEVDTSLIKEASLEQLLQAINQCSDGMKIQLMQKLKEIMG